MKLLNVISMVMFIAMLSLDPEVSLSAGMTGRLAWLLLLLAFGLVTWATMDAADDAGCEKQKKGLPVSQNGQARR